METERGTTQEFNGLPFVRDLHEIQPVFPEPDFGLVSPNSHQRVPRLPGLTWSKIISSTISFYPREDGDVGNLQAQDTRRRSLPRDRCAFPTNAPTAALTTNTAVCQTKMCMAWKFGQCSSSNPTPANPASVPATTPAETEFTAN